jgi:hypothetical protein
MTRSTQHYRPTLARMAIADAIRRPWRLGLLAAGIAVAGAATFGALAFQTAIGRSLEQSLLRLGADALVLPVNVVANLTPAILTPAADTAARDGPP